MNESKGVASKIGNLPDQEVLAAIGEFFVRFAVLEGLINTLIGALLGIAIGPALSVTVNINISTKFSILDSLVARYQNTENADRIAKVRDAMSRARKINDMRSRLAHGTFMPGSDPDAWVLLKMRADKKVFSTMTVNMNLAELQSLHDEIHDATGRLFITIMGIVPRENFVQVGYGTLYDQVALETSTKSE